MLRDIKVLEFEGLAPTVFCGLYFADQGAQVVLVGRKEQASFSIKVDQNLMNRGKNWVALSPKIKEERKTIQQLIEQCDIIIDPYRPGVLQKLGLGPEFIYKINKKAILLRVSGYGQSGPMSLKPGHDLNYISTSGIVPLINSGSNYKVSQFPTNYLADFVSCSLGITATLAALSIAKLTGVGRIVDCSMTDGCRYYAQIINELKKQNQREIAILQPQFLTSNGQEYLVLSKFNDQPKFRRLIEQMSSENRQQLITNQVRISRINKIAELSSSVKQLKNPFDNKFDGSSRSLPELQTPDQMKKIMKLAQLRKSKL